MNRLLDHFLIYGVFGWCAEILWTASHDFMTGSRVDPVDPSVKVPLTPLERWRLCGSTYLWMFPLYGAGGLLFEPLHDALRRHPWPLRGLTWTVLIFLVEYASGRALRRLTGRCPWDYTYARANVHERRRPDLRHESSAHLRAARLALVSPRKHRTAPSVDELRAPRRHACAAPGIHHLRRGGSSFADSSPQLWNNVPLWRAIHGAP